MVKMVQIGSADYKYVVLMDYFYDNASNTFTGTSQSSRNDVIGSDCSRLGETCTGTVSMTR